MTTLSVRFMDWATSALHGKYTAYAIVWGGDNLPEAKRFQQWVQENEELRERYDRPDLYDLWLGASEEEVNHGL